MHNRKPTFYSKKQRKNLIDLSPRLAAKKVGSIKQPLMISQASAQMKKRKLDEKIARLESPNYFRPKGQIKKINEQKQILSEEQIQSSAIYKMLEQEIQQLARRQEQDIERLRKIKEEHKKQCQTVKKQQFSTKLQIWQLKNEVFDIKEFIQQQKRQAERLLEQINPVGQESVSDIGQDEGDDSQNEEDSFETQQQ